MVPFDSNRFTFLAPAYSSFDGTALFDPTLEEATFTVYLLENQYALPSSCADLADCALTYSRSRTSYITNILPSADYLEDDRRLEFHYFILTTYNHLDTITVLIFSF